MITRIDPGARMSEAVIHGDTIYLAGQVGNAGEDIASQTRTALAEIDELLAKAGEDPATAAPNHSPGFDIDESVLPIGVRAHVMTAMRFLQRP